MEPKNLKGYKELTRIENMNLKYKGPSDHNIPALTFISVYSALDTYGLRGPGEKRLYGIETNNGLGHFGEGSKAQAEAEAFRILSRFVSYVKE